MSTKLNKIQDTAATAYADNASVQLRKGLLTYCVLKVCNEEPVYSSDIIKRLHAAELIVVEGTMYPLLSRLQKDGLLTHVWQESEQGPPRKYFQTTELGGAVAERIATHIASINKTLKQL
jgi:PadR family transcriptional regulator PadR